MALMRAARAGIFIKNPDALERLCRVGTVLIDKTGTLTEGRARLARWHGDPVALDMARALEVQSSHAVARAFVAASTGALHVVRTVSAVVETPGRGISGRLDRHLVIVGNRQHLDASGITVPATHEQMADSMIADGLSPIFVAVDGKTSGVAGVGDALRTDAKKTVAALRSRGLRVRILSGDDPAIVSRIAARLELPAMDAVGGLTPEEKHDMVARVIAEGGRSGSVVMVGDGVNDAAALALADVGIAVSGGMGASIVAADIVLTRDGVSPLLDVLDGARRLRGVVRRNVLFSLIYNVSASSLAVAGLVGPLLAVVLMPVSSLTVVLSSALTRTFARKAGAAWK
jgi:Cu2+-exporting ATPase